MIEIADNHIRIFLRALANARLAAPFGDCTEIPPVEEWLLNNGKYYRWADERLPEGIRPGKTEHCYREAQKIALAHSRYTYCEGYAHLHTEPWAFQHAWCINQKGEVVDPSLAFFKYHSNRMYFGVAFKTTFLRKFLAKAGTRLSILRWEEANWPIQNNKITETEWKHDETKTA